MSGSFWANKIGLEPVPVKAPAPVAPRAWWQGDAPVQQVYRQAPQTVSSLPSEEHEVYRQLSRIRATELNNEQMDFLAEYELKHKDKYHNMCPQCGSDNYVPAGVKVGGVTMPTEKCFECGLSARGPEPAVGGRGTGASRSTRQIDTGGGAGSMYMTFRALPAGYVPRA